MFSKNSLQIFKQNELILKGSRNTSDGLWDVPIPQSSEPRNMHSSIRNKINIIIPKNKSYHELGHFYHGALCSPTIKTLVAAIKNDQLLSWPAIDKINFHKTIQDTTAIHMGHLEQERQFLQSTKIHSTSNNVENNTKTFETINTIVPFTPKAMAYGDLTGSFPYPSTRGARYLFIMYDYDSNAILVHTLKTKQAHEIKHAWLTLTNRLMQTGHVIKHYVLDNECSFDLKRAIKKQGMTFQLVPPHNHRQNAAERAIKTFKAHFLSTLATADPQFPIAEWDRLIPQSEMTLNLLRQSRCNPRLSAFVYLQGQHNFSKNPIAPPGTRVIIHRKVHQRKSWDFHGQHGWYVGPALEHYRCYRCYIPSTGKEIITDTVKFLPAKIPFPQESFNARFLRILNKITIMLHPSYQTPLTPILRKNPNVVSAVKAVAEIIKNKVLQKLPSKVHPLIPLKNVSAEPRVILSHPSAPPRVKSKSIPFPKPVTSVQQKPLHPTTPTLPDMPSFQHLFSSKDGLKHLQKLNHIFDDKGNKMNMDKLLLNTRTSSVWGPALENELGRLSQGFKNRVKAQDAMDFITFAEIPQDRKVTYANFICDYRPLKTEKFRVRMTI